MSRMSEVMIEMEESGVRCPHCGAILCDGECQDKQTCENVVLHHLRVVAIHTRLVKDAYGVKGNDIDLRLCDMCADLYDEFQKKQKN